MLLNKNILIVSPERWDHVFVSKHHYARQLAKRGNNVFFLNPPGTERRVVATKYPGVSEVDYPGFPRGLRYLPRFWQRKIIARTFSQIEQLCGVSFNVIWSFDSSVFFDFSGIPPRVLRIFHVVDYNQNFQVAPAAATADFCFCTSQAIEQRLKLYSSRVFKINHGYYPPGAVDPPAAVDGPGPRAVYAGNLSIPYIDWRLLSDAVLQNPDVDFIFAGPGHDKPSDSARLSVTESFKNCRNVRFIGAVDPDALARLYESSHVLMVAYRSHDFPEQVSNPHKMMEYLGSGKVVVATPTAEFSDLYPLVITAASEKWVSCFSEVVSRLDYYNAPELQSRRKAYASGNSYERQVERIETIITGK